MNNFFEKVFKINKKNTNLVGGSKEHFKASDLEDNFKEDCPGYDKLPHILPKKDRIIVLGDLHGDLEKTLKCLLAAKVINRKNEWIGGKTIVVQIGDQLDGCRPGRGEDCADLEDEHDVADIKVMEVLDEIHKKAVKKGGAIYSLLGNHEVMQYKHDRYVSKKSLDYFNDYVDPISGKEIKNGKHARLHAFAPGNEYANKLACTRTSALIIGSNLFVHAGILPILSEKLTIKEINLIVRKWLLGKLDLNEDVEGIGKVSDIIENYKISPFWPRLLGSMKGEQPMSHNICSKYLKPTLKVYKLDNMIIGHTPQFIYGRGISGTCYVKNGKNKKNSIQKGGNQNTLWRIDVGMSDAFSKFSNKQKNKIRKVQILEIKNDKEMNIITEV